MRNTSDPIKENLNVMNTQGGEKKVMKKILSVALSTAMAFSMFASVAFGDTAVSPQQQFDALKAKGIFNGYPDGTAGLDKEMTRAEFAKVITKLLGLKEITGQLSYTDKNYTAKNWAVPYIEAVTAAGIMEGKNVEKKIFDFNGKVTVAEMATILTRALDLEVPAETDNSAPAWAKGYVQAAINAGLVDAKANFNANASRELLVGAAYAIDQAQSLKVTSYEVSEAGKVVTFKISDGESVKVTLDKALEANKETEVKFTYKDKAFTEKVTYVVTTATKVESAAATNLKQVVVTFDGTVDHDSAETVSNYTISGVTIESATASADKKSVTLLLADNSNFVNQRQTTVTVNNVKNADGSKTISGSATFAPLDVAVPTVESVEALGTKALKIKFSEPVKQQGIISSNFRIDDKAIAATVQYTYPDTVILATELTEGAHTLRVSNVTDFSGLTIVPNTTEFTAKVDTAAPVVSSVTSKDLKQVTVTFDEPVKSVSGAYANVTSFTPATTVVSDNKVTLTFTNPLNASENNIRLNGVTDYSGNSANLDVKVTPSLDTVRPVVVDTKFAQENGNYTATLVFSKTLDKDSAQNSSNYVLRNAAGNIPASSTAVNNSGNPIRQPALQSDGKTVVINFGPNLNSEVYSLTIAGVKDSATIGNVLLPYTVSLSVAQASTASVTNAWKTSENGHNYIYVQFNRALATDGAGSAVNATKYLTTGAGAKQVVKTDNDIQLITANTVRLEATNLTDGEYLALANITANYIADSTGAYLAAGAGYSTPVSLRASTDAVKVTGDINVTDKKTVVVKFDGPVSNVVASNFEVQNASDSVVAIASNGTLSADQKTLTLTLDRELAADFTNLKLVRVGTGTVDAFGNVVNVPAGSALTNKIAASLVSSNPVTVVQTAATDFEVTVKFDKDITISSDKALIKDLLNVVVGSEEAVVDEATIVATNGTPAAGNTPAVPATLKFTVSTTNAVSTADAIFSVSYAGGSTAVKANDSNVSVAKFSEAGRITQP
ncbi:S-layer homology domain-containing protein [Paenibacillus silvae]|uniref:S-layer homology domain-containing protein n=1 Tax=Paenibacillus silvae TaxID=1325358 RepID=UPI00200662E9|nr:S-layer homology domain-containing protein [Paenibacillus silvae]MCK6075699.1 S-layer homology domain-containing protein [Paenibacillus silvae]MCK6150087.1 S-layer homology domain-containing protein [Paenibacillus silvae]MCK6268385.1 S-layer homology domain-containing protein [Paenibacillus silvae]